MPANATSVGAKPGKAAPTPKSVCPQSKPGQGGANGAPSLSEVVAALCKPASYAAVRHGNVAGEPMPSVEVLGATVERLRAVLFPGYFGAADLTHETMPFHVGTDLDLVHKELSEQIRRGFCFLCQREADECLDCGPRARELAMRFLGKLPRIRELLASDVQAAYVGDPAAKSPGETIFCYPSIYSLTNHRIAHELHKLGVAMIPRIIAEMAHSRTGIDIHPGARIGPGFFIDHGTGTVIGETCEIGRNVRLYQGVTLGAKSFPKAEDGSLIKGIPRHPVVEDDVVIYSGATILGRVTIGRGAVIGGNVWITESVPPGARILQAVSTHEPFEHGSGI